MNKNLLLSQKREEFLAACHALPDDERRDINHGLQALAAYYAYVWDKVDNFEFASRQEKRHTLLAYKYLGLVWFDRMPNQAGKLFTLQVNGEFPAEIAETILDVFAMTDEQIENACADILQPAWCKHSTARSRSVTFEICL